MTPAACNHTLCHTDAAGTWRNVPGKDGRRKIVCRLCGTFYGYLAPEADDEPLINRTGNSRRR